MLRLVSLLALSSFAEATDKCPPKIEALKSKVGEEVFDAGILQAKQSLMTARETCDDSTIASDFKSACESCISLGDNWASDYSCIFIIGAEISCDSQTCASFTETLEPILDSCVEASDRRLGEDLNRRQNARQWVQQQLNSPIHQLPSNPNVLNQFMSVVNGVYDERSDDPDWNFHRSELIEARKVLLNNYEHTPKLTWALEDGKDWLKSKMNSLLLENPTDDGKNQAVEFVNVLHDEFSKQWITMLVNGEFDAHEKALEVAKKYLLRYDDGFLSNNELAGKEWLLTRIHSLLSRRLNEERDLHI
jgi:hypothetical protein